MPANVNEFIKGDNRDIDVLKMPNDTARRIQNMRVLDVDGKGFVLTNIGGTEAKFRLTPGFIPLGKCEYNGIGYIASLNILTGEGEIGCYPAPDALKDQDATLTGWSGTKEYAPLFNFTGVNSPRDPNVIAQAFRTELFDFDCQNQIDMFAREDYDGSVGLYLAQKGNPIRVINSGFDQDGSVTSIGRRYWNNSFPNAVNLLHESEDHIDVDFLGLGLAGTLRGGNWMFFVRYSTENFDKTSFHTETNAIQITDGTYSADGIRHHGVEAGEETDKSVKLRFSNLDPTYSYLEVGYIYNFDGTQEFGIIDKLYPIDPNQSTLDIEITGYESSFEVGIEQIIGVKPNYDGATTHTQLENRYFAGNLFDTTEFDTQAVQDLLQFSRNITCQYDDTKQLLHSNGGNPVGIYNQEINVYNFTGHFRGEPYPYGVVFVLKNGRETQSFPVTGSDDWSGAGGATNDQGVYRFPNVNVSPTVFGQYINVMGIKFDISAAFAALPQYIQDNVSGFYFVRGERNPTLLYQGVSLPCYNANLGQDPRGLWFLIGDYPQTLKRNENNVPMFEFHGNTFDGALFPYQIRFDLNDVFANEWVFATQFRKWTGRAFGKWGYYSPDHFFNKSLGVPRAYTFPFASINFGSFTNIDPSKDDYYYKDSSYSFATYPKNIYDVFNVAPWEPANNNGYTSFLNEGARSDFNAMFYFFAENLIDTKYVEIRSLQMAWNSYIGINAFTDLRYKLSNIYKTSLNPGTIDPTTFYDVKSTKYYKISKFFKIADVLADNTIVNDKVFYKGDCFLQRTWLKQLFNPKYGVGVKDDGGNLNNSPFNLGLLEKAVGERLYTFGTSFSFITENRINTEMRVDDFINKFYPGSYDDVYEHAVKDIEKESELLNRGYNVVLSQKFYTGVDEEIPFYPEDKPVGIMYSNKHNPGSLLDGYRAIDLAALREYDYRMGSITSLQVLNNLLISIQEEGLNRHFVNEKAVLNQGSSAGEMILGTGDILDPKHLNITDFVGSQHQWSIVATDRAVYGVDFNKRKIWRIMGNLQYEIISDSKGYRQTLHDLCEMDNDESDKLEILPDNPVCTAGIVAHYDRKHNDVYFTWIYGNPSLGEDCKPADVGETIVFNEWLDAFHGDRTIDSPMRMNINEDFFSWDPDIFPSMNPNPSQTSQARLHDIFEINGAENATTFFGNAEADISYVEFIVNNPADIAKVFDNLEISSSPHDLYRVTFETQHQEAIYFPWVVGDDLNYWRDPQYVENLWKLPIIRTQSTQEPTNNIYDVDSRFRGRWIKIRLEWKTKSRIFIKSVLTHVRESHN